MTIGIIIVTVVVSIFCFRSILYRDQLSLRPYLITHKGQWYRIVTHGFVHADWTHLLVNMLVLWSFGTGLERFLASPDIGAGAAGVNTRMFILYFGGLVAASLYDVIRYRNTPSFSSIGASGAVSAVVFAMIFYNPMGMVWLFAAIPIPGFIFGIFYLLYEGYSAKHTTDRINHHAHLFGALYGLLFPILTGGTSQLSQLIDNFRL